MATPPKTKSKRIPRVINLGCGVRVRIEELSRTAIQSAVGRDVEGAWSVEVPEGADYVGVILLDKTLAPDIKRKILFHELAHAINDIYYWCNDGAL